MARNYRTRHLMEAEWVDPSSDPLEITVTTSSDTGEAFITVLSQYAWLTPQLIRDEVIPFLQKCCEAATTHNMLKELREKGP